MRIISIPLSLLLSLSLFAQTPTPKPTPKPKYQRVTSHVVLISIGGLQGLCVTKLSNCATPMVALQRWRERGVIAQTAESVYPTQTLPAHAAMLTGRLPVDHKVTTNQHFDEARGALSETNLDDAQRLPKENLLNLLEKEKLSVAAIGFPMTAGAAITTNHAFAVVEQPSTRKAKETLGAVVTRDRAAFAQARETIAAKPPNLLLIHFNSLDTAQQLFGLASNEAAQAKREIDNWLQQITEAYDKANATPNAAKDTTWLIVSDHGAMKAEQSFAPNILLAQKGWLTTDKNGQVTDWKAIAQPLGGAAMVFVKKPQDEKDVFALFQEFHQKPDSPIWRVITRQDAAKLGADERGAVFLDAAPDIVFDGRTKGSLLESTSLRAASGHLPSRAEMQIAFVMAGKAINSNAKLPYARLIDVAPTIARLFGLEMKAVRGRVLNEVIAP
jgi:predicted AlkP superfamily pyrophosphatase or phosphodiesterase